MIPPWLHVTDSSSGGMVGPGGPHQGGATSYATNTLRFHQALGAPPVTPVRLRVAFNETPEKRWTNAANEAVSPVIAKHADSVRRFKRILGLASRVPLVFAT